MSLSMSGNIELIIAKTKTSKAKIPDTQANESNTTAKTEAVSIPVVMCNLKLATGPISFCGHSCSSAGTKIIRSSENFNYPISVINFSFYIIFYKEPTNLFS